jgi:hypothetical protein
MTGVEDLLRTAAREKAAEIAPDSIPPLDVAELSGGRARRRRYLPPRSARWPRLAVPLAAALAVVAVVALSVALPRVLTGRGQAGGSVSPPATGTSGPTPAGAVPPYYVALAPASIQPDDHPVAITVRSTMTGAPLATVGPPAPYGTFSLVARGDGDDTFLVGVQRWRSPADDSNVLAGGAASLTLMLLHFDPSTRSVSFSSLPVPALSLADLQSVALSPDGTQLAVAVQPSPALLDLDVYSLADGGVRTWSLHGAAAAQWSIDTDQGEGSRTNPNAMSWLPDGQTLAFDLSEIDGATAVAETVRELDVDGPGGALLADSRAVFTLHPSATAPFGCLDALQLSADAATVTCVGYEGQGYRAASAKAGPPATASPSATTQGLAEETYGFGVFFVATGRLTTVLDPTRLGDQLLIQPRLFWQGGGTLIGTLTGQIIILSGSQEHITPWELPVTPAGLQIASPQNDALYAAW